MRASCEILLAPLWCLSLGEPPRMRTLGLGQGHVMKTQVLVSPLWQRSLHGVDQMPGELWALVPAGLFECLCPVYSWGSKGAAWPVQEPDHQQGLPVTWGEPRGLCGRSHTESLTPQPVLSQGLCSYQPGWWRVGVQGQDHPEPHQVAPREPRARTASPQPWLAARS